MTEDKKFPVPRKLRNTAKQSMLISGQPDFLYRYNKIKETFIVINNERRSIGRLSDEVHLALEDLAKGKDKKIIRVTKTIRSPVSSVEGFPSLSIQKHRKDTMIVVPAANEEALMEKVSKLKELIESKGAITQERCNWMCIADKGKVQVSNDEIIKAESVIKVIQPENINIHFTVKDAVPDNSDVLQNSIFEKGILVNPVKKEMSEKTKSLRDIALKAIKEQEKRP